MRDSFKSFENGIVEMRQAEISIKKRFAVVLVLDKLG